nr:MAG TPA: hypothetical protein [Caudoviricetes sp.]
MIPTSDVARVLHKTHEQIGKALRNQGFSCIHAQMPPM